MNKFHGFSPPSENWSKLPHELIDELPNIHPYSLTLIIYILRHTWGYGDDVKRISLNEFQYGRKDKDGNRMDNGTGMAKSSIIKYLQKAVEDGYLYEHTDNSDEGRIKKYYSLNEIVPGVTSQTGGSHRRQGGHIADTRGHIADTRGHIADTVHRKKLKKETLEIYIDGDYADEYGQPIIDIEREDKLQSVTSTLSSVCKETYYHTTAAAFDDAAVLVVDEWKSDCEHIRRFGEAWKNHFQKYGNGPSGVYAGKPALKSFVTNFPEFLEGVWPVIPQPKSNGRTPKQTDSAPSAYAQQLNEVVGVGNLVRSIANTTD